jgi:ATP-dependent DNA helicase RecQ
MESYYQEIGRAGRNGVYSNCVLFYERDDMTINRILLRDIKDPVYKRFRESQIRSMERYLKSDICRRVTILSYFGETIINKTCSMCDNCVNVQKTSEHIQKSIQYPIYLLLKFMVESKINSGFKKIANILIGKKESNNKPFQNSKFFGLGKDYSLEFWKHILNICVFNDLLQEETIPSGFGIVFKLTSKTTKWYETIKNIITINKIKSDEYERIMLIMDEIKDVYSIPRDSSEIQELIKKRSLNPIEDILENNLI